MTRRIRPLLLVLLPALGCSLSGTTPPGEPDAESDADAGEGEWDPACNSTHLCFGDGCGRACQDPGDCPADLTCLASGICSRPCAQGARPACGCGWYCGEPGDGSGAFCLDTPPCATDADCPAAETCSALRPVCDGAECAYEPFCASATCTPGTAGCAGPGEACGDEVTCYNDRCLGHPATCLPACRQDADCPDGQPCGAVLVTEPDGSGLTTVDLCLDGATACGRDEDCDAGKVCGVDLAVTPTCVDPLCTRGAGDCGDAGADCSGDTLCYNRACLGSGGTFRCHEFCRAGHDEDCDVAGERCRQLTLLGNDLPVCLPVGASCQRDEDCDAGKVCGAYRDVELECRAANGTASTRVAAGEDCNKSSRLCYNGLCLGEKVDGLFSGICYEVCDPDREDATPTCPVELRCGQVKVKTDDGEVLLDACVE